MKKSILFIVVMASALIRLFPQEKLPAAKTFLETKERSGIEAALSWLGGLDAEKAKRYLCEEKDFLKIGKEMKSSGHVEEAARFFEKATELIPQSSVIWENLGTTHVRLLRKDEAIRCFQQAITLNPKNGSAQEQLKMIDILLEDTRYETREKMRFHPGENTGLQGPYLGQLPPGLKPELFAPGIVSVFGSNENTVTISPDGRELYFGKESGIWVCRWTESGWSSPQNTGWPGYEMWISPESGKMYYTGYEPGIWVMERSGATWGKPQKLVSNGMFSTLTRDETLYTTVFSEKGKANVGRYVKKDGKYETPEVLGPEINSPNSFDAHPNVAADGSFILFDRQRPEGNGLFISFRDPDGSWGQARFLGADFKGSVSTFSPDGKYLFFMKNRDIYWVSAKIIEELNPTSGASLPQFSQPRDRPLSKLNEKLSAFQPFIGKTWVGTIPDDSRMGEIILSWKIILNGFAVRLERNTLKFDHWLETTYYWDESSGKIAYLAISNNGYLTKGYLAGHSEELISEGIQQGPDSQRKARRTYRLDKDGKLYEDDQFLSSEADGWRRTHLSVFVAK